MGRLDRRMLFCVALIASHFQGIARRRSGTVLDHMAPPTGVTTKDTCSRETEGWSNKTDATDDPSCDAEQIIIKKHTVPPFVQNGADYVILDCDYDLQNTPIDGLYVKWWHNENDMVYQWIYNIGEPQALPPVDKYIDLNYKASDDPTTMYRAMKLDKPGVDLTGDYTCTVSTTDAEDSKTKPMIVYSTANPKLYHKKTSVNGVDGVELTCVAEGLYPKPTLDVSVDNVPVEQKPLITEGADKRYNITTRVELRDEDVQDPSNVICVLGIPAANYTISTEYMYYPGPSTTTTTASTTLQRKMDIQALDNSQRDTDNGGGSGTSSISNGMILLLVCSVIAGNVSRF